MLSSITPVGEGSRSQRWSVTVVAFTLGSVLGGAGTGLLAGGIGQWMDPAPAVSLAVLAVAAAATIVADLVGPTPPSLERQVDRTWMTRYRGWVYGLGYGVQLGCGFATYISSWATWLWLVAMVLVGDLGTALAMGMLHGAVRGASLWTTAPLTTADAIRAHHRLLHRIHPWVRRGAHLALGVAVVAAGTTLVLA